MSEEWRVLPGDDRYRVSNLGRVLGPRGLRKPYVDKKGYHRFVIYRDGRATTAQVHRLVLEAFVGPCPEGMEALHIDGDPGNNSLRNLRWGTHAENVQDAIRHGTHTSLRFAERTHCPRNHPYDDENTRVNRKGQRSCRTCERERLAAR